MELSDIRQMYCPNCGRNIRSGDQFCGYCGKQLPLVRGLAPSKRSTLETKPEQTPERGMTLRSLVPILMAVFLAISIGSNVYQYLGYNRLQSEESSLRVQYNRVQSDYSSLNSEYSTLSSDYSSLKNQYNGLKQTYDSLRSSYDGLSSRYNGLQKQIAGDHESTL